MRFLKKLIILALVAFAGLYFYGRSLPREHRASSTITLVARADTVYRVIRNVRSAATWWTDVKAVRPLAGKPRESWEEDMGASGKVQIEITSENPGSRLVTTILNDDQQDWGGRWIYTVNSSAAGTEVTITEDGWVAKPLYRVVAKLLGHHRTIDSYLNSLAAYFGEVGSPRHGN